MICESEQRFPFCIVWTILPCITWLLPWVGHVGICDSEGTIYDFLGYHINFKQMAFGKPVKYVRLYVDSESDYDKAIKSANNLFCILRHDLCGNNCHHHVAQALNAMNYEGSAQWTQFSVWWMCLTRSSYVSRWKTIWTYGPFLLIVTAVLLISVLATRH